MTRNGPIRRCTCNTVVEFELVVLVHPIHSVEGSQVAHQHKHRILDRLVIKHFEWDLLIFI
jgi:hypothetical protein